MDKQNSRLIGLCLDLEEWTVNIWSRSVNDSVFSCLHKKATDFQRGDISFLFGEHVTCESKK